MLPSRSDADLLPDRGPHPGPHPVGGADRDGPFLWMLPLRGARITFGLVFLGIAVWVSVRSPDLAAGGATAEAAAGMALAGLGWLVWLWRGPARPGSVAVLAAIGIGGGVACSVSPAGFLFLGTAAAGAALTVTLPTGLAVAAVGPLAFIIAAVARDALPGRLAVVAIVVLIGFMSGNIRRQSFDRARQSALVALADERSAVAAGEAELVAERNRLGRELHDVLAHTLGALSVQLSALDALVAAGADPTELRAQVERSHVLVDEGLDEAHQAVRALRESRRPLCEELAELCRRHHAAFTVTGEPAPVSAEASLALYRAAQEAITNATKHAPGAPVTVHAGYDPDAVRLTVTNPIGAAPRPAPAPSGFGLVGMRERILLVGGRCDAGADGGRWRVTAQVPR